MDEKKLTLEGILQHIEPKTIKDIVTQLNRAINNDWFYEDFKPSSSIVAARDAATAYLKREWPNLVEDGDV